MRLALALMMLALPAAAQDVDCVNAESQVEMTYCSEADWKAADAELNDAYRNAMDVMKQQDSVFGADDHSGADALRTAQRTWVTFRDQACDAEGYMMRGGTGQGMAIYQCLARLTRQRTEDLDYLGDVG